MLVSFITGSVEFVLSILPTADSNIIAQISESTLFFRNALISINWLFPVDTALLVFSSIFVIQLSLFLFKIIKYVAGIISVGLLK